MGEPKTQITNAFVFFIQKENIVLIFISFRTFLLGGILFGTSEIVLVLS